jgi:hypothetical protein
MKTSDAPLYLSLRETRDGQYYHMTASFVIDSPKVAGDSYSGGLRSIETYRGLYLRDLSVNSQGSSDQTPRRLYAWDLRFMPYCVEHADAVRMVNTFKVLNKRIIKTHETMGRPVTFGQYLGRVALAVRASGFVYQSPNNWQDDRPRFTNLQDGIAHVDYTVERWIHEREERPVAV